MEFIQKLPKKILISVDLTEHSKKTVEYGKALAKNLGSQIVLMYVAPLFFTEAEVMELQLGKETEELDLIMRSKAEEKLKKFATSVMDPEISYETVVKTGAPPKEIAEAVEELGVDLVLVGCHRRTGAGLVDKIVERVPCPVLVVK